MIAINVSQGSGYIWHLKFNEPYNPPYESDLGFVINKTDQKIYTVQCPGDNSAHIDKCYVLMISAATGVVDFQKTFGIVPVGGYYSYWEINLDLSENILHLFFWYNTMIQIDLSKRELTGSYQLYSNISVVTEY